MILRLFKPRSSSEGAALEGAINEIRGREGVYGNAMDGLYCEMSPKLKFEGSNFRISSWSHSAFWTIICLTLLIFDFFAVRERVKSANEGDFSSSEHPPGPLTTSVWRLMHWWSWTRKESLKPWSFHALRTREPETRVAKRQMQNFFNNQIIIDLARNVQMEF